MIFNWINLIMVVMIVPVLAKPWGFRRFFPFFCAPLNHSHLPMLFRAFLSLHDCFPFSLFYFRASTVSFSVFQAFFFFFQLFIFFAFPFLHDVMFDVLDDRFGKADFSPINLV